MTASDIPDAVDQTPTLTESLGCMDCDRIFRTGSSCPFCFSTSLLNVAGCLGNMKGKCDDDK